MWEWIAENPYRAIVWIGGGAGVVLSTLAAAVRAGWPDSPWGRALDAAAHVLPGNVAGAMRSMQAPGTPSPLPPEAKS